MFEQVNLILFFVFNAHADLAGWQMMSAQFAAVWLILLVPFALLMLWVGGARPVRTQLAAA